MMKADGLHGVIRGAKIKTTKPDAAVPRPADLVERRWPDQPLSATGEWRILRPEVS
jgi:hypothetical protein